MYFFLLLRRCGVQLGLFSVVVGSAITSFSFANAFATCVQAQVVPDNTLGTENSTVTNTGNVDAISGGATRGGNLFHSFDSFSVQSGRTARFDNAASIQNILTRVTGGSVSNIEGTLAAGGTANLFLLNPNGIIFGQNASLNIGGSFIGTTARSIDFADGTQFSATPGSGAPLLTVNVPVGLQFGTGAGNIISRAGGVGLQVSSGRTLGLVGGNVSIDGGNLTASGGRVELGAVAAPGVVGLNLDNSGLRFSFPNDLALGDISVLNDSFVNVSAGGGGSIAVNARNLNVTAGSELGAGINPNQGAAGAVAGNIDINAQDTISIDGQNSQGFASGFFNSVQSGGTGNSGNINVRARSLSMTNGARLTSSVFGQGNAGNVELQAQDSVSLDNSLIQSNVGSQQATIPSIGNAGNIRIKARTLSLANGAQIQASFFPNARQQGNPGVVSVEATDSISAAGRDGNNIRSAIFTDVESGAVANGSDIQISAPIVSFNDAVLDANMAGQGNAGNVNVTARDRVSLDNSLVTSSLRETGTGRGGNINVRARSLSLTNGTQLATPTFGQGNAGNIQIDTADSVNVNGGAALPSFSSGRGNAGNVTVNADGLVSFDGAGSDISSFFLPESESQGEFRAGDISIKARSLSLTNGVRLSTDTASGQGNAGNIRVDATDDVSISGGSELDLFSGGRGNAGNVTINAGGNVSFDNGEIFSILGQDGIGRGGDINIKARSLSLANRARISTSTLGQGNAGNVQIDATDVSISGSDLGLFSSSNGNAGNVTINAGDRISLDNSRVFSELFQRGTGRGGDVRIQARSLSLNNGASLSTSTFGQGDAGNINIAVDDAVTFEGSRSGVFSQIISGIGNGGDININAGTLLLRDGAQVNAVSSGTGNAGNVTINAINGITINGLNQGLPSAIGSSVEDGGTGRGGNIDINIRDGSFSLTNGGLITTSVLSGQGNAGDINIKVRNFYLDQESSNRGGIFAATTSGNGGNIRLQASKSVRLRNGSRISTSAGGTEQPGNGGNITIDSPLVIANRNGNNNITANAFNGRGGRIAINAQSIFGLTPRNRQELQSLLGTDTPTAEDFLNALNNSPSNDVAAISLTDPALSGTVSFNAADIDPSRDIVELPTGLTNASEQVAAGCPSGAENRFAVTGRGGLPPAPGDKLSPDAILTDWATLQTPETENRAAVKTTTSVANNTTATPLVEASSWQFDRNGAIILTSGDATSSNRFEATPSSCSGS